MHVHPLKQKSKLDQIKEKLKVHFKRPELTQPDTGTVLKRTNHLLLQICAVISLYIAFRTPDITVEIPAKLFFLVLALVFLVLGRFYGE